MKYTTEIEIHAPIEKVAALLGDHEQMKKWLPELQSYKPISGKPREVGTKTELEINKGGQMQITETILEIDFPYRFAVHYETAGVSLIIDNQLQRSTPMLTRYILSHHFKFSGVLKIATALMKAAFVTHSEQIMKNFKAVAEES